jgi:predicted short-subunit dehydrogenase-like oxidoreductase (DUF2520 family)
MALYTDVSFIGSGNVAWHLAQALENAGHHIHEIFSRESKNAKALTSKLYSAEVATSLDFSGSEATIFVVAVNDDVIDEIASEIILPANATIVHTSGSCSMDVFNKVSHHYGVFYPFQSFNKARKIDFKKIPILIEGSDSGTGKFLLKLGKTISSSVELMNGEKRSALHISAVFASNFTNHLLSIAKQLASSKNINFELLEPLVIETINKGLELGPENTQTGPAARGDLRILDQHLSFLEGNKTMQEIYKILSQDILDRKYYE